jgi:5,5'-dehydrodivanillate O-demethylase
VPIDDENMQTLSVAIRPAGGNQGPRKKMEPDPNQLTADVLAGKIRVQDIDPNYPGLFVVQDNVALAGQGRIVDRSKDWLGQSDKGIILLRKLWERELKKISAGKPIKAWQRPKEKLHLVVDRPTELAQI